MIYTVTINDKQYEVEVEKGKANLIKTTAVAAAPAAPVATAPVAAPAAPAASAAPLLQRLLEQLPLQHQCQVQSLRLTLLLARR